MRVPPQSVPMISAAFAAMLTEGKTVREIEALGVFVSSLATDIFTIAALRAKNELVLNESLPFGEPV